MALLTESATPAATGYEISIYQALPWYFWVLVCVALACGLAILVEEAFASRKSRLWTLGYSAVLSTNAAVLLLPFLRGYETSRGWDVLTHIGFARDISTTGTLALAGTHGEDPYPAMHIILVGAHYVTGVRFETLAITLPAVFTLFYMVCVYLLARALTKSRGQTILVAAFGSLLLFRDQNLLLFPSMQAFQILPITLYLYYRAKGGIRPSLGHALCLILVMISTPLLNPGEGTLFLLLLIGFIHFASRLYSRRGWVDGIRGRSVTIAAQRNPVNPTLILAVTWFLWFSAFVAFDSIRIVIEWFVYGIGSTTATQYAQLLGRANLSPLKLANLALTTYGQAIIYMTLGLVLSVHFLRVFSSRKEGLQLNEFVFSGVFLLFGSVLIVAFFAYIYVGFEREMRYAIFAATIIGGMGLYRPRLGHSSKIRVIFVGVLLVSAGTLAIFNAFPSPIDRAGNYQATQMEFSGTTWFLDHRDQALPIYQIGFPVLRFAQSVQGVRIVLPGISNDSELRPPDHFGYNRNRSFGSFIPFDSYFIDSKFTRDFSPNVYPEFEKDWTFTPGDFARLGNQDYSVNTVYSDGELWIYYVQASSGSP